VDLLIQAALAPWGSIWTLSFNCCSIGPLRGPRSLRGPLFPWVLLREPRGGGFRRQSLYHITVLELLAVPWLWLGWFRPFATPVFFVPTDNTTVVAYINHDGGTRSPTLNRFTRALILWCLENRVSIRAVHIAGADYVVPDRLSRPLHGPLAPVRDRFLSVEWSLDQGVALQLYQLWGTPVIDLFATVSNRKVDRFCSLLPHPLADPREAFSMPWDIGLLSLYPPVSLAPRSLHTILREAAEAIMVLPYWPRRGWFPMLLRLSIACPIRLPLLPHLVLDPQGSCHPGLQTLSLPAWRVSGDRSSPLAFRCRLPRLLRPPCILSPGLCTRASGARSVAGVVDGVSIPFDPLCLR
jgi:hypothetical protein